MSRFLCLLFVLSACRAEPTQLLVVVDSNLPDNGIALARVDIEVRRPDQDPGTGRGRPVDVGAPPLTELPFSFGVAPRKDEKIAEQTAVISVTAYGMSGPIVERRARVGFLKGKTLHLSLFLAFECIDVVCAEGLVCDRGNCINEFVDPTLLSEVKPGTELLFDASVADARPLSDAGMDDAPPTSLPTPELVYPWNGVAVRILPELVWRSAPRSERDELQYGGGCPRDDYIRCEPTDSTPVTPGVGRTRIIFPVDIAGRQYWRVRSCAMGPVDEVCSDWSETRYIDLRRTDRDIDDNRSDDIAAGAPGFDVPLDTDVGEVHFFAGDPASPPFAELHRLSDPVRTDYQFGRRVAFVGDVMGESVGHLAISFDAGFEVYQGTPGRPTPVAMRLVDSIAGIAGIGDVNGDGFADLAVGVVPLPGAGPAGVSQVQIFYGPLPLEEETIANPGAIGDEFGASLAGVGDINGDGLADFVVGAPGTTGGIGAAYVFAGSRSGPTQLLTITDTDGGRFGSAVAGVGDVTGDDIPDFVVGQPDRDGASGGAVLYAGGTTPTHERDLPGTTPRARMGESIVALGDLNGDGLADFAVSGGGSALLPTVSGHVMIYRSGDDPVMIPAPMPGTGFGRDLGAADLAGDGRFELVVSAPVGSLGGGSLTVYTFDTSGNPTAGDAVMGAGDLGGSVIGISRLADAPTSRLR